MAVVAQMSSRHNSYHLLCAGPQLTMCIPPEDLQLVEEPLEQVNGLQVWGMIIQHT